MSVYLPAYLLPNMKENRREGKIFASCRCHLLKDKLCRSLSFISGRRDTRFCDFTGFFSTLIFYGGLFSLYISYLWYYISSKCSHMPAYQHCWLGVSQWAIFSSQLIFLHSVKQHNKASPSPIFSLTFHAAAVTLTDWWESLTAIKV